MTQTIFGITCKKEHFYGGTNITFNRKYNDVSDAKRQTQLKNFVSGMVKDYENTKEGRKYIAKYAGYDSVVTGGRTRYYIVKNIQSGKLYCVTAWKNRGQKRYLYDVYMFA